MVRVYGCSEMPRLQNSDFDTDKYKCIASVVKPDGVIACAFMSQTAEPPHYRVVCGRQEMFFTHRKDALDCLEQFKVNEKKKKGERKA